MHIQLFGHVIHMMSSLQVMIMPFLHVVSINRIANTSISSLVKDAVLKWSAHCKLYMHCLDTTFYSPCVQKYIQI